MLPADQRQLADDHRIRQQQLALRAVEQASRAWMRVDPAAPSITWRRLLDRVLAMLGLAMGSAAQGAQDYVATAMRMQGFRSDPFGTASPAAFRGVASDGRPLTSLLWLPGETVADLIDAGMDQQTAYDRGGTQLRRIVATQVQDTARVATGVAGLNDRRTRGYIRHVTPPACARCIILAGQWYPISSGFQRHPQCDCVHFPAAEVIEPQDPRDLFDAMTEAEQHHAFGKAGARAIRDGADLSQVVNARRGMYTASMFGQQEVLATREGATRRGLAGQRLGARNADAIRVDGERYSRARRVRLMPEQIYRDAERFGLSREETLGLLRQHGYII